MMRVLAWRNRPQMGRIHKVPLVPVLAAACLGTSLLAGCSASIHVGASQPSGTPLTTSPPTASKAGVEYQVAHQLAQQLHQPVPKVVCPGDLKEIVGTVMYCTLTPQESTDHLPVQLTVDSVHGSTYHYNIVVSTTPGRFTPPSS